jgi:hypothetical protein
MTNGTIAPNRYGRDSEQHCWHGVDLWRVCDECNDALEHNKQKQEAGNLCIELPNLVGTGNVLVFDQPKNDKEID